MFKKVKVGTLDLYTPFNVEGGQFLTVPKDDPGKFLNDLSEQGMDFHMWGSGIVVQLQKDSVPGTVEKNELVPGTYRYKPASNTSPEGLIRVDIVQQKSTDTLDILSEFEDEINWFKANKDIYKKLGQKATRGILLYGPPGFGKTLSVKKAVASLLQDSITIYIDGDDIPSVYFVDALNKTPEMKTIIIEEFANVFTGHREISYILEFLDGSNSVDNAITVLTTNHPERIPSNVLRHGRVDKFIRVDTLSDKDISGLLEFFGVSAPTTEDIKALKGLSVVQIKECILMAARYKESLEATVKKIKQREKLLEKDFKMGKSVGLNNE